MDRDIRTYFLFIGLPAVLITAAGLFALVFGVSGIAAEMKYFDEGVQLGRYERRVKDRMATRLKNYPKNGKADFVWSVDSLPWSTNELSRVKYGIYTPEEGVAIGWAKLDGNTVIGYRIAPFAPRDRTTLYLFVVGVAMVTLLFSTLFAGGMLLARAAKRARDDLAVKNSFLDMISHELNTPLGSIVPLSSALANGAIRDESRKQAALATISRESARMSRMISELLAVVRLRNGKMNFSRSAFDVLEVAEHAASLVRARHPDCAIRVARDIAVMATADADKTEQVLINLLENACLHAGEDVVDVSCSRSEDGYACIEVADRGTGLSEKDRKHIFERFYQASGGASGGGLGLGLNIVSGFVHGMGGSVDARPREGGGSVFCVKLPCDGDVHRGGA